MNRRGFLYTAGAAATLPLLGNGTAAAGTDPDQLFLAGRFAEADLGYRRILQRDPSDAHAWAQRGYIALLSNRFRPAEEFLSRALRLAPADSASAGRLADCYVRQDDYARAVPLLRAAGNQVAADQYAGVTGRPFRMRGAPAARLPFEVVDPLPVVRATVNGITGTFFLDTGATFGLTAAMAERAGVRELSSTTIGRGGQTVTLHYGVADSLRLGGIEVGQVPVLWNDLPLPTVPGVPDQPVGALGTTIFYHFLTTMDYAGRALVLRRTGRRPATPPPGAGTAPLWLAPDHFLFSRGGINGYGPGVVRVDTGGPGFGVGLTDEVAALAGVVPDRTKPERFLGVTVFPCVADRVSVGGTPRYGVPGIVGPLPSSVGSTGFASIATVTHEFFRPLAVTFDFAAMAAHLTGNS